MTVDTTRVIGCVLEEVIHDAASCGSGIELQAIPRMAGVVVVGIHIL